MRVRLTTRAAGGTRTRVGLWGVVEPLLGASAGLLGATEAFLDASVGLGGVALLAGAATLSVAGSAWH